MPASTVTIPQLVTLTCDSIAAVLDSFRSRNPNLLNDELPTALQELKRLKEALERLEDAANNLDNGGAKMNEHKRSYLNTTLNDCGRTASTLKHRIECGSFRDDFGTIQDIQGLITAVDCAFEGFYEPSGDVDMEEPMETSRNTTSDPSPVNIENLLDTPALLKFVKSLRKENDELHIRIVNLQNKDEAKLHHIHRLHSAIKTLNKVCPPPPKCNSWESLSNELSSVLDDIQEIQETLEHLKSITATTPTTSKIVPGPVRPHAQTDAPPTPRSSAPTLNRSKSAASSSQVPLRPPSPTESNVSSLLSDNPRPHRHPHLRTESNAGSKRKSSGGPSGLFKFN